MEQNNNKSKSILIPVLIVSIILSSAFGAVAGFWAGSVSGNFSLNGVFKSILQGKNISQLPKSNQSGGNEAQKQTDNDEPVVDVVSKVSPAVVNIIISKNLPLVQQYDTSPFNNDFFRQFFGDQFNQLFPQDQQPAPSQGGGTQKTEVGGGSGFIVSEDGYIVTNKHVASDKTADYTVLMNDGTKYPAKILAQDPSNDIAILKINAKKKLPTVELGDSSTIKVGQLAIAIGNALGEFRNTVSTGVISGLSRSITAGGADFGSEQLTGVIQTDASINLGNSGGPLLNREGQVIGINTAIAQGAQNIGFALPINEVKNVIESVKKNGRIVRPWLGLRFMMLNKDIADKNKLPVDYGALIVRGETRTDLAVIPGSPADKAGIVENDIILEVNGKKLSEDDPLNKEVAAYNVGDTITLKVLHKGKEQDVKVKLEEMK